MTSAEFKTIVKSYGFKNISQFAQASGIHKSNLYRNFEGPSFKERMSVSRMFQVANTLGAPFIDVVRMFYTDEMEENENICQWHLEHPDMAPVDYAD